MQYRNATLKDIPGVSKLQQKYHISTIREEDKPDGFVTTLFTEEQFKELIEKKMGLLWPVTGIRLWLTLWPHPGSTGNSGRCFNT